MLEELEFELEERLLEAHWLLGDDSSAPVELSKQWEEMVVSKGWLVGGQHNHGYEDERQENHGGGKMGGKAAKGSLWEWGARKDWVGERTTEKKGQHIHRFLFFIKYGHKTNKIFEIRNSSTNRNIFTFS